MRERQTMMRNSITLLKDEQASKATSIARYATNILILVLTVAVCMITLQITMLVPLGVATWITIFILPVSFGLIYSMNKHWWKVLLAAIAMLFVAIYSNFESVIVSLKVLNSFLIRSINFYYDLSMVPVRVRFNMQGDENTAMMGMQVVCFLSILLGMVMVKYHRPMLTAILLSPFIACAAIFSETPNILLLLLFLVIILATALLHESKKHPFGEPTKTGFVRHVKKAHISYSFVDTMHAQSGVHTAVVMLTLLFTAVSAITFAAIPKDYKPSLPIGEKLADRAYSFIEDISNGNISFERRTADIGGGVSGGDLVTGGNMNFLDETHLVVSSKERVPMYIKAYVGGYYENNRWHDYKGIARLDETMPPSLIGSKFLSYGKENEWKGYSEKEQSLIDKPLVMQNDVIILNKAANDRYVYRPYNAVNGYMLDEAVNLQADGTIINTDRKREGKRESRTYQAYLCYSDDGYTSFSSGVSANLNEYSEMYSAVAPNDQLAFEKRYSEYADVAYTATPNNDKLQRLYQETEQLISGLGSNYTATQAVDAVREYIHSKTQYSLTIPELPRGEDFVDFFLYESGQGLCMHYATTAAIMLRHAGIPTRYVEGYTISLSDYKSISSGNLAYVKDSNAHAWIEIYEPPVGWVPYEVTPGFTSLGLATTETPPPDVPPAEEMPSSEPSSENTASDVESMPETSSSNTEAATSSSVSSEPDEPAVEPEEAESGALWLLLKILLLLPIVGAVIYIRRRYMLYKRRQELVAEDNNQAAISAYRYILRIMKFMGCSDSEHVSLDSYAQTAEQELLCKLSLNESFKEITKLAQKASFSNTALTDEERRRLIKYANLLSEKVYNQLSFAKRLEYMWLSNLI